MSPIDPREVAAAINAKALTPSAAVAKLTRAGWRQSQCGLITLLTITGEWPAELDEDGSPLPLEDYNAPPPWLAWGERVPVDGTRGAERGPVVERRALLGYGELCRSAEALTASAMDWSAVDLDGAALAIGEGIAIPFHGPQLPFHVIMVQG